MTVTITTADFVGVLSDTIPFAFGDDELPAINAVRLHWDGDKLHAQSTDRYRIAWASWHPDDEPERDYQQDMLAQVGSGDDPWTVLIPLDDAKDLVKNFKLPAKEAFAVLTLDADVNRLTVKRARETGHSALRMDIDGLDVEHWPNVEAVLSSLDVVSKVDGIAVNAKYIADFAKVRSRGGSPLSMRFTGDDSAVLVSIGERFVGSIMPVREGADQ